MAVSQPIIDTAGYTSLTTHALQLLLQSRAAQVEAEIVVERQRHTRALAELNARLNQDCAEIAKELRRRDCVEEQCQIAQLARRRRTR